MKQKHRFKVILMTVGIILLWAGTITLKLCLNTRTYSDYIDVTFHSHLENNAIIDGDIDCLITLDEEKLIDNCDGIFRNTLKDSHFSYLLYSHPVIKVNGKEPQMQGVYLRYLSLDDEITVTFPSSPYPLMASLLLGKVINPFPNSRTFTVREEIDRQNYIVDPAP